MSGNTIKQHTSGGILIGNGTIKLWTQLEQSQTDIPLKAIVGPNTIGHPTLKAHPLIGNTLCICSRAVFPTNLSTPYSPLFPILGNLAFTPGMGTYNFPALLREGLSQALHFLSTNDWPSIMALTGQSGQIKIPFWKASQLHNFLHSLQNPQRFNRRFDNL